MKYLFPVLALLSTGLRADLVITEVMADSFHTATTSNGDWWELTNTGSTSVNLAGYYWDDAKPSPSTFPSFTIQAGESIIILAEDAINLASWRSTWGLTTSTRIIAKDQFNPGNPTGEAFSGLSTNGDEVNLYNPSGILVAHAEFGASTTGTSFSWLRDGSAIYGLLSQEGYHGAIASSQSDTASPGDAEIHFTSVPAIYGSSSYLYNLSALNPGGATPTLSEISIPSFLTLTPGSGGSATLTNNRPFTLADAGDYLVEIAATSGGTETIQDFLISIFNPSPSVILNEYNAVDALKFLNGGTELADDDGAPLSADSHFGRVAGNGGPWVELVVTGDGGIGETDLRGWSVEIGKSAGSGFVKSNTLVFSSHSDWQSVPNGTLLTLISNNTAQGGLDTGFAITDNNSTTGDTWSNVWIGDTAHLTYSGFASNGYILSAGIVSGINIDNDGTQFQIKNASGQIVFGPVGEGIAPDSGTSSTEIFELENHPTPAISPIVATTDTTQGYDDGAAGSTFGSPNQWTAGTELTTQSFTPYALSPFSTWASGHSLTGDDALRSADPDDDGRSNLEEYAFGGDPNTKDAAYPAGALGAGAQITWSQIRRNNDPSLLFSHETSDDLSDWSPITPTFSLPSAFAGDPDFSEFSLEFARPVPTPAKWFLRTKAE